MCGELGAPGGASELAPALGPWVDGGCAVFIPPGVESRCSACTAGLWADGRPGGGCKLVPRPGTLQPTLVPRQQRRVRARICGKFWAYSSIYLGYGAIPLIKQILVQFFLNYWV